MYALPPQTSSTPSISPIRASAAADTRLNIRSAASRWITVNAAPVSSIWSSMLWRIPSETEMSATTPAMLAATPSMDSAVRIFRWSKFRQI
jgi:hypothetical protein